jgi:hypothetical protein
MATFAVALLVFVGTPAPVLGASPLTLTAVLSRTGETPPVTTNARGEATVTINAERTELTYRISFRGLTSELEAAAFCVSWDPTVNICAFIGAEVPSGSSPLVGTRSIASDQRATWLGSPGPWVQLATTRYPAGEIRGPLLAIPPTSTITPNQGRSAEPWIPVLCLAAAIGGWIGWRGVRSRKTE